MRKPFEQSEATKQMIAHLKMADKGSEITYAELSRVAGKKVDAKSTVTVRRQLLRNCNAVWVCVQPHVGLRRLKDDEIAERLPGWWLNGGRNKLTRGGAEAEVVEMRALDIDQQSRFAVDCIQRELAFESLSKAMRRRMEKVARGTSNDLPSFSVVEWAINLTAKKPSK